MTPVKTLFILAILLGIINHASAEDVPGCGDLQNPYGPFNYNTRKNKLRVVEKHHFTPTVENLIKGQSGPIDGDIDYTLRASPNHHRALFAIIQWENAQIAKNKLYRPKHYSAECYIKRAIKFAPKDPVIYMIYGLFNHKRKKLEAAIKYYQIAIKLDPGYTEAYYNLGILYYEKNNYRMAEENAMKAYDLNYPLPGLRSKLIKSGHWDNGIK